MLFPRTILTNGLNIMEKKQEPNHSPCVPSRYNNKVRFAVKFSAVHCLMAQDHATGYLRRK